MPPKNTIRRSHRLLLYLFSVGFIALIFQSIPTSPSYLTDSWSLVYPPPLPWTSAAFPTPPSMHTFHLPPTLNEDNRENLPPYACAMEANVSCRRALFTGCSYSGSGFLSKLFTSAGYPIGHECLDQLGVSDWRKALLVEYTNSTFIGFKSSVTFPIYFSYVLAQVRHPLDVVTSWIGTQWKFEIPPSYNCAHCTQLNLTTTPSLFDSRRNDSDMLKIVDFVDDRLKENWTKLPGELKMLETWTISNQRALSHAHLWWRLEEFTNVTALHLCKFIHFDGCEKIDWNGKINMYQYHNKHKRDGVMRITWHSLCGNHSTSYRDEQAFICSRGVHLCRELGYTSCDWS